MSQDSPIYTFRNVSHIYSEAGKIPSLIDINLEIRAGEAIALIGEIGSGKSTLFKLLVGLLKPTKGTIQFKGVPLPFSGKRLRELRRQVGILFQFAEAQIFEETVFKEVAYALSNFEFPEEDIHSIVAETLTSIGLPAEEYMEKSPFEISGGEQKRVALASVLAFKPKLLLLDEPAASLDYSGKTDLIRLLKNRRDTGEGFIVITHDLDLAMEVCDRVMVLREGRLVYDGSREIFYDQERLQDWGLETPELAEYWADLMIEGFTPSSRVYSISEAKNIWTGKKS
jgi:energy-coupling factor transport system ATP-binding protein